MQYYNIHTHAPVLMPAVAEIESIWYGQPNLPTALRQSAGLHPWYLMNIDLVAAAQWLRTEAAKPHVVAIGEAGLDKITTTPWDIQLRAFEICLQVAQEADKPVIIHCVRAYNEVLQCLRLFPNVRAVFHGFDKNAPTAARLLKQGYYLSFGAALFRENSHAAEVLRQLPADRFVLETDDSNRFIATIYERAAVIRDVPVAAIGLQIEHNVKFLFGY